MKVNLTDKQIEILTTSLRLELSLGKYEVNYFDKKLRILKKLEKAHNEQGTRKH